MRKIDSGSRGAKNKKQPLTRGLKNCFVFFQTRINGNDAVLTKLLNIILKVLPFCKLFLNGGNHLTT